MVDTNALSEMTIAAFCKKAVRNVVMIDEQFPNLHEALLAINEGAGANLAERYKELEVALGLYQEFHAKHLLCDVANTPMDWTDGLSSRISECDLVVLDLHLREGSDSTDSIDLLRSLADSLTFNLVVVYTRDTDLTTVAYRIAGSLRGKPAGEVDEEFEVEFPEVVSKLAEYQCPDAEVVDSYLHDRQPIDTIYRPFVGKVMNSHPQMRQHKGTLWSAIAVKFLEEDYGAILREGQRYLAAADLKAANPWMVFENVFVVVANKKATPPSKVIPVLEKAILEWNPGIVRTLVVEIQNAMSRRGYAFGDSLSSDLQTQVGWLWHATSLGSCANIREAVKILLNRMLLGLRKNLLSDEQLAAYTEGCLAKIPTRNRVNQQIEEVSKWCGPNVQEEFTANDVLHALNSYQSSYPFEGEYMTTGTIMFSHDDTGPRWWVCVEPACNTIPSQAPAGAEYVQFQLLELRNRTADAGAIVAAASRSKHLFVVFKGKREYLSVVNEVGQPMLRVGYAKIKDQIKSAGEYKEATIYFPSLNQSEPTLVGRPMTIVSQLHEPYGNQLLHLSGHHLSRVGLDFVDRPLETSEGAV